MQSKPEKQRKVATPKQTSGLGFVFEDKVAAWYILHLLLDSHPFNTEIGKITRIDFQVRPDGWLFDDILIRLKTQDEDTVKVAASVKSNKQFNSNGPTTELLSDLWHQYLNIVDGEIIEHFDSTKDYFGVISSTLSTQVSTDLNDLISLSKKLDAETFLARVRKEGKGGFSKSKLKLFNTLSCPKELASEFNLSEIDTCKVLSRIILMEFDFENDTSRDNGALIQFCREALAQPDGKEELKLYDKICSLRQLTAPGQLDYEGLLTHLRNSFNLKGLANHTSDWEKISQKSKSKIESIQDKIGGKYAFKREDEVNNLTEIINKNQVVFTLGDSGFGKTVIVRKIIEQLIIEQHKVIWLDSSVAESGNLQNHFDLENSLPELIKKVPNSPSFLVIDGIDRFMSEGQIALFRSALKAACESNFWKIIVTCQTDDYEKVLQRLHNVNLNLDHETHITNSIGNQELLEAYSVFPDLKEIFKHTHLTKILKNLKYLDLLTYNLAKDNTQLKSNLIGESQMIDWVWGQEIENQDNGISNSRFVQLLAEIQADTFTIGVPITAFDPSDLVGADQLSKNKFIYKKEDRLYFTHDLFGDWARYKILRQEPDFKSFILDKDLVSPLWCKAIRLYGVYLLEKTSNWISTFERFLTNEPKEIIIRDLLLEAILFSSSTLDHLENLWHYLKQDKGELLRRFLERFQIKATIPNNDILSFAKQLGSYTITEASTIDRIPIYTYWPELIQFIHNHCEDIIENNWGQAAEIAYIWLKKTPGNTVYRKEAGSIALNIVQWMIKEKGEGLWFKDNIDEIIHKAYLEAVYEHEDEVTQISLKLCKRVKPKERKDKDKPREIRGGLISRRFKIRDAKKWEDGPFERVDDTFSKVCLNDNGLNNIIKANPKVAQEILLALLISHPSELSYGYDSLHYHFDLIEPSKWYPPFYTRGPFLYFLNTHPEEGINAIIKLINFATQQWANLFDENDYPRLTIEIDNITREFIGDETTYWWYRDKGPMPHSIVSALMALEKFFYDELDKEHSIEKYIQVILSQGNSVAYLGLLSAVGKYRWELFKGFLKPLLAEYHLYFWERSLHNGAHDIEGFQMIAFHDSYLLEKGKEWHSMNHRKYSINQVAISYCLSDKKMEKYLKLTASGWKKKLEKESIHPLTKQFIENLILQFDKKNYSAFEYEGKRFLGYKEPEEQTQKLQASRQEAQELSDDFIFSFRCLQDFEQSKKLSLDDVTNLWNKIQKFDAMEVESPYGLSPKYQGVFGGFALLIQNREVWRSNNPEYLEVILKKTKTALLEFEIDSHDLQMHDIGHSWNSFIARFLPLLWVEDLSNKVVRELIGLTIIKSSYDVLKILFESISKQLKWSDKNFIQLQNFLVSWSVCAYKHGLHSDGASEESFLGEKDKLLKNFINERISQTPTQWTEIRLSNSKRYQQYDEDITLSMEPGLDSLMIYKAFSSCLPTVKNISQDDLVLLTHFWDQVVDQIVFELGPVSGDSNQPRMHPHEMDYWILDNLALLILHHPSSSQLVKYWQPLFKYGYQAHHWIEQLLNQMFLHTLDNKELYPRFFEVWMEMIGVAEISISWKNKKSYKDDQLWESLMGMSYSFLARIWTHDYKDFLQEAKPSIIKWFTRQVLSQDAIRRLMQLLRTKSGEVFIVEGVPLLYTHIKFQIELSKSPIPKGYVYTGFEHEDSLAKTSSHIWENHRDLIRFETKIMASFKEIVVYLVAKQNPIGLELQEKIIE